jgi:hypothetical protein
MLGSGLSDSFLCLVLTLLGLYAKNVSPFSSSRSLSSSANSEFESSFAFTPLKADEAKLESGPETFPSIDSAYSFDLKAFLSSSVPLRFMINFKTGWVKISWKFNWRRMNIKSVRKTIPTVSDYWIFVLALLKVLSTIIIEILFSRSF